MSRQCEVCGKGPHAGRQYTHRGLAKKKGGVGRKITGRTKRVFAPNLQTVKTRVKGAVKRLRVCAKCLRSGKVVKVA